MFMLYELFVNLFFENVNLDLLYLFITLCIIIAK